MDLIFIYIKNYLKIIIFFALLFNLFGALLLFFSIKKDDRMLFDDKSGKKYNPIAVLEISKAKWGILFIFISVLINMLILPLQ